MHVRPGGRLQGDLAIVVGFTEPVEVLRLDGKFHTMHTNEAPAQELVGILDPGCRHMVYSEA